MIDIGLTKQYLFWQVLRAAIRLLHLVLGWPGCVCFREKCFPPYISSVVP